jgi:hypothetical protein
MSYPTQGASNRQIYDCCAYSQSLQQSVDPLQYQLYFGAQENCSKCIDKQAWFKQDKQIVDIESDLWNINRPLSKCDMYKYNPNCKTSPMCTSTFDPSIPRVLSPSLCPIVYNNIPKQDSPGYTVPNPDVCGGRTGGNWTEASSVNTYSDYDARNRAIIANSKQNEDVYMFLNNCNQQPLYNSSMEQVKPYYLNTYNSAPVPMDPRFRAMPTKGKMGAEIPQMSQMQQAQRVKAESA